MSRRGRCRCGWILQFESGPDGYKMRCPQCHSVVRLRVDAPQNDDGPRRRKRSGVLACHPPAPSDPDVPYSPTPLILPEQYNYEALRPGELPVVELVPLSDLAPAPRSFWRRWWLPLTAVVLAASTVLAIVLLRG